MPVWFLALAASMTAPAPLDEINTDLAYIEANLPLIARYIGKPHSDLPALFTATATNARTNYAAATNLLYETRQLRLDLTRTQRPNPGNSLVASNPLFVVGWDDVHEALQLAGEQLQAITRQWRLPRPATRAPPSSTPDAAFARMSHLARTINRLLDTPDAPYQVYHNLTRALGYSSTLLSALGATDPIPRSPPFRANKQAIDVFRSLLETYTLLETHRNPGAPRFAHLQAASGDVTKINSGDVNQLAILLQVDLAWLHHRVPGADPPPPDFYPGVKFPSHVLQRAAALKAQLRLLMPLLEQRAGTPSKP